MKNQNTITNKNKPVPLTKNQPTNQNTNKTDHHHHTRDNNHDHHTDQMITKVNHIAAITINKIITNHQTKNHTLNHQTDHHITNHMTDHKNTILLDHKAETNHQAHNKNNFQAFCQESIAQQTTYHGYQKTAKNAAHTPITTNVIAHNITDSIKQNAQPAKQVTICHQNVNHAEANHQLNPKITMFI